MATLMLTAIGTAIGGPIGGAVGALIGQGIDQRVFRAAAKDGPRLTELAVQTSSYGTAIPRLFGRMRVSGTVIWATDLIEHRERVGGGKGSAGTNRYSYSASFAVALSARPVRSVGRIWAEGVLIRGAAGDWKVRTGFRLHHGGEDQPVDPLIASAEGATPAYRGLAYAVFEGLQLETFGNRIPSLTFEVVADDAPVPTGTVAASLCEEVTAAGGLPLAGFAATGSARGVLETLATIDGGWWRPEGARIVRGAAGDAATAFDDDGFSAGAGAGRRGERRTVAPVERVPRAVSVAYHDPARDYQAGVQRVRRPGAGLREDRIDLPAVLGADVAKGVAAAILARGEVERTQRMIAPGLTALAIAPGMQVRLDGATWRVSQVQVEAMAPVLTLVPLAPPPAVVAASSGRVSAAADLTIGRTVMHAVELPGLDDVPAAAPRVTVFAAGEGEGWRTAALLYSLDDGASWMDAAATAAPAILGRVSRPPDAAQATLVDHASTLEVTLAHPAMTLGDADGAARARGVNLALVGDELIQFGRAEPLGQGRWRLRDLWRGLRGSETAIGTQQAGDRFVLIEAATTRTITLPREAIGTTLRVLASGLAMATRRRRCD
ncbi:phage tail protein [Sphingomonas sp. XXL09]|uniref:phage tail protein n=1 Tax=Sphingomonas sp. XXL09 TaxID=3457787 RepID=UPI00406BAECD